MKRKLFAHLSVVILILIGTFIYVFFDPESSIEIGGAITLVYVFPVITLVIGVTVWLFFRRVKKLWLSAIAAYLVAAASFVPYINSHVAWSRFRGELAYQEITQTNRVNVSQQVTNKLQQKLPKRWKLKEIVNDPQSNINWFVALEPSIIKGSITYVGAYKDGVITDLVSIASLWERFKMMEHLPKNHSYELAFPLENHSKVIDYFDWDDNNYHVMLSIDNHGKIQITL